MNIFNKYIIKIPNVTDDINIVASTIKIPDSITVSFDQNNEIIYASESLENLKRFLTVNAIYDEVPTEVSDYALLGSLMSQPSIITAFYASKTDTFSPVVTPGFVYTYSHGFLSEQEFLETSGTLTLTESIPTDYIRFQSTTSSTTKDKIFDFSHLLPSDFLSDFELEMQVYFTDGGYYSAANTTGHGYFRIVISNGVKGVNLGIARYANGSGAPALRYTKNGASTATWSGTFTRNAWHTINVKVENQLQTISIDDTVVESGAYLGSAPSSDSIAQLIFESSSSRELDIRFRNISVIYNT